MLPDEVRKAVDHIDTEFSMGLEPFESAEDRTEFMDQRCFYVGYWEWIAIRAHLLAREAEVERHVKMLAECFRMAGADPDGNEDWRIAPDALRAVTDLRRDYDDVLDWQARAERAEANLEAANKAVETYREMLIDVIRLARKRPDFELLACVEAITAHLSENSR